MLKNTSSKGAIFILLSAFFYGSYGIWSKLMAHSFDEFSQAWTRALLLLIILIPFGLITKKFKKIAKKDLIWFVVISLAGGLNQAPYFFGFKTLGIGTTILLFYTSLALGTYIIGKFFFNEKINLIKLISLILAIIGMSFIYSFTLLPGQAFGAFLTMLAGFMGSAIAVFSKKISTNYSETQILTSIFTAVFIVNLIISKFLPSSLPELTLNTAWLAQFGYTASALVANVLVIAGFKYIKEPSVGGLIGLVEIIFGVLFGIIFFQEALTASFLIGSGIILVAMALPDLSSFLKKKN
jgi:drug/metabolite transporter (DMT)-like permease